MSGTARLEAAVAAYRDALQEYTRERGAHEGTMQRAARKAKMHGPPRYRRRSSSTICLPQSPPAGSGASSQAGGPWEGAIGGVFDKDPDSLNVGPRFHCCLLGSYCRCPLWVGSDRRDRWSRQ